MLEEASLPMRVTAWSQCFRAEAGAAGKDTRGMLRQHQFSKVELVSITTPEQSTDEHERMTKCAEEVLKRLELPFRTVALSTGDMGFAARQRRLCRKTGQPQRPRRPHTDRNRAQDRQNLPGGNAVALE